MPARRRSARQPSLGRQPVIPACHQGALVHALLHHGPGAVAREEEAVVIDLEAVLHGGRIDLRREPAGANEWRGILAGGPARGLDLLRCLARRLALAACNEDPGLAREILQALLQGAAGGRGQAAAMPIETEDAAEGLEPDRIGKAAQEAWCAFL